MRKYILSLFVILLLITSITSVTYAWFTYVEKKSLASFEAGVLSISMLENNVEFNTNVVFDDLAFMDYENEFITNDNDMTNIMAANHRIDILLDDESPLARANITLEYTVVESGLIYLVIFDGINLPSGQALTSNYYELIDSIISGLPTKEDQLNAIDLYNQNVLNQISAQEFGAGDHLVFQIVAWGDYDALSDPQAYLETTFYLNMHVEMINSKGVMTP